MNWISFGGDINDKCLSVHIESISEGLYHQRRQSNWDFRGDVNRKILHERWGTAGTFPSWEGPTHSYKQYYL